MNRIPRNIIVQIQNSFLAEFLFHWVQYDKPCSLLFIKPKTDCLTGIKVVIDSSEADDFLKSAQKSTGCKLIEVNH